MANQRIKAIAQYEVRLAAAGKPASSSSSSSVAMATATTDFPRMPTENEAPNHRDKLQVGGNLFNAAAARTVAHPLLLSRLRCISPCRPPYQKKNCPMRRMTGGKQPPGWLVPLREALG